MHVISETNWKQYKKQIKKRIKKPATSIIEHEQNGKKECLNSNTFSQDICINLDWRGF